MSAAGQFGTERLGFIEVDPVGGNVVAFSELSGREPVREFPNQSLPLPLSGFPLCGPETSGQGHLDLGFVRPASALRRRAPHAEAPGWTPAHRDPLDVPLLARLRTTEGALLSSIWRQHNRAGEIAQEPPTAGSHDFLPSPRASRRIPNLCGHDASLARPYLGAVSCPAILILDGETEKSTSRSRGQVDRARKSSGRSRLAAGINGWQGVRRPIPRSRRTER